MIVVEKKTAFTFFRQLLTDTITAFEMLDISSSGDLLVAYQNFMAQETQPAVFVRALLQSFLVYSNMVLGQLTIKEFTLQDIRSLVLPIGPLLDGSGAMDDIPTDQQIQLFSQFELFVNRCGQSFVNLFRTFCLNRCRVRRTLCHAALEWDQIQAEAEDLDALAQSLLNEQPTLYPASEEPTFSYSFSSWVYHYKLMQLRIIAQMGFELSIYAPHEFADMYWYLSFLSSTHISHLERMTFFVSSNRQSNTPQRKEVEMTMHRLYRHFTWLKATEAMTKALHRVFAVIQRHGHLARPSLAYTSSRLRYELRMRPFQHLSIPEPINFDLAQQSSSLQDFSDQAVLEQASRLNQTARKAWEEVLRLKWNAGTLSTSALQRGEAGGTNTSTNLVVEREWTKDVRNAMKACIGTAIAISALSKALQGTGSSVKDKLASMRVEIPPVENRDRWHSSWPVPKIFV